MTIRYVGAGGNDSNDGLSWANRKLTLNGVEDTPIQAGDTVYVAPGVYRETLTCDVDGTSGAGVITYIGDYDGSHTDGVGGIVRISGSNNDTSATRTRGIYCTKDYRTFKGFTFDYVTQCGIELVGGAATNVIVEKCYFQPGNKVGVQMQTATTTVTVRNCYFDGCSTAINITHSSTVDSSAIAVENCIFTNSTTGISLTRYGGVTVRNCLFWGGTGLGRGVHMATSPAAGQTCGVYNCLFWGGYRAMEAATAGFLVEDYNNFIAGTARVNVAVGAHSTAYPIMADPRWFFEMVNGGTMLTPFDLASYSQLINVAGTSPTTADMRGTTKQGTQREWGALEYDSTLDIEAGTGTGGGAVRILPFGGIGL